MKTKIDNWEPHGGPIEIKIESVMDRMTGPGNSTTASGAADVCSDSEDSESDVSQYYYYAFLWKIILLLWDLSGIVIHVRIKLDLLE